MSFHRILIFQICTLTKIHRYGIVIYITSIPKRHVMNENTACTIADDTYIYSNIYAHILTFTYIFKNKCTNIRMYIHIYEYLSYMQILTL